MNNIQHVADEFFKTIPDRVLVEMAQYDWNSLKKICVALTLELQLIEEQEVRKKMKN